MKIILHSWWLAWLVSSSTALAADLLPLCPTHPQFFPQKLPMHCRMPRSADPEEFPDQQQFPTLPPLPDSFFQTLPPHRQPPPIPIPIPPFPGMPMPGPMGVPMPGQMPGPGPMPGMPGPIPGMPGMPGGMPMPMPMPIPMVGGPPHKLPVIVMPFYSQDHSAKKPSRDKPKKKKPGKKKKKKKKKKNRDSTDEDTSSCEDSSESDHSDSNSSSEHGFWKGRRRARGKATRRSNHQHRTRRKESRDGKNDLLTPILQYVTKDGYVIFEKKISKNEAQDWLKEFKPKTEMTENREEYPEVKPEAKLEEKPHEEYVFNPRSAEKFFKLDEEEKRLKAMEINKDISKENSKEFSKEAVEMEVTTGKPKRQHRALKFNPLMKN